MGSILAPLFTRNRAWSERIQREDPDFFHRLSAQQNPRYLWIGCADSRVPASQVLDLMPGEVFVHRNIANVVVHSDLNCLSVIEYAVKALKVEHIIVCGHYGCGGVQAALRGDTLGFLANHWLLHIQDVVNTHRKAFQQVDKAQKNNCLCELNVIEQVLNVSRSCPVRQAWENNHQLQVHGLIYGLADGRLHDLEITLGQKTDLYHAYKQATEMTFQRYQNNTHPS